MAKIAAILLAAGESLRMGAPKPLLAWGDETLVEYQVRQLRDAGADPVICVVGHRADEIGPLASRAGATVVTNERYREGRASSVIAGAGALPGDVDAIVVLSVDEPRPSAILRQLIEAHTGGRALITRPAHNRTAGHPPVLDTTLIPDLLALREETQGLREVITRRAADVLLVEMSDAVVLVGFNTPEEYDAALIAFAPTGDPQTRL